MNRKLAELICPCTLLKPSVIPFGVPMYQTRKTIQFPLAARAEMKLFWLPSHPNRAGSRAISPRLYSAPMCEKKSRYHGNSFVP